MPAAVLSFIEQIENATGLNILSQFAENKKEPETDDKPKYTITHKPAKRVEKRPVEATAPEPEIEDHVHEVQDDSGTDVEKSEQQTDKV